MKKVLIIHNKYINEGGEDIAVDHEINLLKSEFITKTMYFQNSDKNKFLIFFLFIFNSNYFANKKIKRAINDFKPDFIYFHNTWFTISLGIFRFLKKNKIKTFIKLHNFRYSCTKNYFSKNHIRNKNFCKACGNIYNKKHLLNYYYDSFFKSLLISRYGKKYYKILQFENISIFVLTKFHLEYINNLKFDNKKIFIFPNYLDKKQFNTLTLSNKSKTLVYAGRISKEKGIEELIINFQNSLLHEEYKLIIIGDGPLLNELKQNYKDNKVSFFGKLDNAKTLDLIRTSTAVVTCTSLYEGQPTLLCEASLLKTVSIFPDNGGISEFFPEDTKFKYNPNISGDFTSKLNQLLNNEVVKLEESKNYEFINKLLNESNLVNNFKNAM